MTKYKFSNKLMFALVMQDEEICAEFIQRLFPGKKVKSITFPNDIQITPEKTIATGVLSKSVRLDVLFEGETEVYDIEMQVETEPELPKRSRYYHTSMDTHFLKKGKPYKDLKPSYVIFICMKDPFEKGEAIYQFQMIDKNLQLQLNDETYTLILAIEIAQRAKFRKNWRLSSLTWGVTRSMNMTLSLSAFTKRSRKSTETRR